MPLPILWILWILTIWMRMVDREFGKIAPIVLACWNVERGKKAFHVFYLRAIPQIQTRNGTKFS